MDAKSRANFINSVASGAGIPCPGCGTLNKPDSRFCISCGSEITSPATKEPKNTAPAFEPVKESAPKAPAYEEPSSAFAHGLPEWSLEPPQVVIRRR